MVGVSSDRYSGTFIMFKVPSNQMVWFTLSLGSAPGKDFLYFPSSVSRASSVQPSLFFFFLISLLVVLRQLPVNGCSCLGPLFASLSAS